MRKEIALLVFIFLPQPRRTLRQLGLHSFISFQLGAIERIFEFALHRIIELRGFAPR
jgi:hypothetical protein